MQGCNKSQPITESQLKDKAEHAKLYIKLKDPQKLLIVLDFYKNQNPSELFKSYKLPILAASHNSLECLQILQKYNFDLSFTNSNKHTALHEACFHGHLDCAKFILEHDKNALNEVNLMGFSCLRLAIESKNNDLIDLLLNHGATLAPDSDIVYNTRATQLLKAAIKNIKEPIQLAAYQGFTDDTHPSKCLKLSLAYLDKFYYFNMVTKTQRANIPDLNLARKTARQMVEKSEAHQLRINIKYRYIEYLKYKRKIKLQTNPDLQNNDFLKIFGALFAILNDTNLAASFLEDLDSQIKAEQAKIDPHFSFDSIPKLIKDEDYYQYYNLFWPPEPPTNIGYPNKQGVLNKVLLKTEQEHQINLPYYIRGQEVNPVPVFSSYVDPVHADELIQEGRLFQEYSIMGNAMLHGKYIHRIQWHIIIKAIESGFVDIGTYTVKDILAQAVSKELQDDAGTNIWGPLIDTADHAMEFANDLPKALNLEKTRLGQDYNLFGLHSVFAANSFLMFTDNPKLQNLRGYLILSFWNTANKLLKIRPDLDYATIIKIQAASLNRFDISQKVLNIKSNSLPRKSDLLKEHGIIWKRVGPS